MHQIQVKWESYKVDSHWDGKWKQKGKQEKVSKGWAKTKTNRSVDRFLQNTHTQRNKNKKAEKIGEKEKNARKIHMKERRNKVEQENPPKIG